jgi:sugar phosphate isomerase/epimerase
MTSVAPAPVMRFAVNATSLPHDSVWQDIENVAACGATSIGLWERKLPVGHDEEVATALNYAGLKATFCVPAVHLILPSQVDPPGAPTDPLERVEAICASIRRLSRFGPELILVGPGASGSAEAPAAPLSTVLDALPAIGRTASECGVWVGLELLAARRGSPLNTLPNIVSAIEASGTSNVGVMVSVFHSWDEPDIHQRLRDYASWIRGVQVCDVRVEERSPFDRELPGLGRSVAPAFMRALRESGYAGWWELEIFSDDGTFGTVLPDSYWAMPPRAFLIAARKAFEACWRKSGPADV